MRNAPKVAYGRKSRALNYYIGKEKRFKNQWSKLLSQETRGKKAN